jgi:hypothetical protein
MAGCYTWKRQCIVNQNPCAAETAAPCAEPQAWFWILAGALAVGLIAHGRR